MLSWNTNRYTRRRGGAGAERAQHTDRIRSVRGGGRPGKPRAAFSEENTQESTARGAAGEEGLPTRSGQPRLGGPFVLETGGSALVLFARHSLPFPPLTTLMATLNRDRRVSAFSVVLPCLPQKSACPLRGLSLA